MRTVNLDDPRERLLPADFERMYEMLWHQALKGLKGVHVGDPIERAKGRQVTRLTTNQVETRGGAHAVNKATSSDPLGSERALAYKSRIDRKLRKISRQIKRWLDDREDGKVDVRRCSLCRQFGEPEWTYCPKDGKPMQSI
jgi:hypothetical protein